jgi:SAM-dependent methyltransferase
MKESSFYVTDRGFEQLSNYLNLTSEEIDRIPEDGKVLEIGSGVYRNFASELSSIRPDLKVISLDPTLGIKKDDFLSVVKRDSQGKIESIYYTNKIINKDEDYFLNGKAENTQKVREERIKHEGLAVAALAPNLPFKNESFDLIVDTFGPGLYLHDLGEIEFNKYLKSVFELLKPGGEARIFPVIKSNLRSQDLDELRKISQSYYKETIEKLGLNCVLTFKEIPGTSNEVVPEILMIMKKIS